MITRNLHNYLMQRLANANCVFKTRSGSEYTWSTDSMYMWASMEYLSTNLNSQSNGHLGRTLRIGSGTTSPSYDDYDLGSMIDAAPKNITSARRTAYDTNYDIVTSVFLNETDSDWIVTEVGLYISSPNTTSDTALLLAREVFDPVTVKPGQTFSVSMKLF